MPPTEARLMTEPPLSFIDARQTSWVHWTTAHWLTCTVLAARDSSIPMSGPMYGLVAALLTRMSTDPNLSMVAATQEAVATGSPALAAHQATSPSIPGA